VGHQQRYRGPRPGRDQDLLRPGGQAFAGEPAGDQLPQFGQAGSGLAVLQQDAG